MTQAPSESGTRPEFRARRHGLVLLLAVHSGATDAIGFLALGGAFTSVMTGNLVLSGVGLATGDHELLLLTVTAIICFAAGCGAGALLAGSSQADDSTWPRPITVALLVQLVITLGYALTWWFVGAEPGDVVQLVLLLVNAVGLGLQSSAVQRFGESGLSTTYLTGTLTTMVIRLVTRHRLGEVGNSLRILAALMVGAVAGAALVTQTPMLAPVLQLGCLGVVVLAVPFAFRHDTPAPDPVSRQDLVSILSER